MASIEKREHPNGRVRWRMRVFVGRDEGGRQRFINRTFDRKKDAEKEARRLERMRDHGVLREPAKMTFLAYLTHWLGVKAGEIRVRTLDDYRGVVRRWVEKPPAGAPHLGHVRLDRLGWEAFEELYAWMYQEKGLAPRTIQGVHVVFHQALKDAVKKGAIATNPTEYAKRPKRSRQTELEETTIRAMTKAEADRFLEAATSDRYHALWTLLLLSGLRPGEAYGLSWDDIDLARGTVRVRRSLTRRGTGGWLLTPPKTKQARRTVRIPPVVVSALREWRKRQATERLKLGAEWVDNDLAFTTLMGSALDESRLSRTNFRRVMERAALGEYGPEVKKPKGQPGPKRRRPFRPAYRIYDLRHTCATLLLLAGEHVKVVSERLGHASITLTADTYSHVLPDMQEGAVDRLEAMFAAPTEVNARTTAGPNSSKTDSVDANTASI